MHKHPIYMTMIYTWVSFETLVQIATTLEHDIFTNFGWTVRIFTMKRAGYVVFGQILNSCEHTVDVRKPKKARDTEAIELYPIVTIPSDDDDSIGS